MGFFLGSEASEEEGRSRILQNVNSPEKYSGAAAFQAVPRGFSEYKSAMKVVEFARS